MLYLNSWRLHRGRFAVIREREREELAVGIVNESLAESDGYAVRRGAIDLPIDDIGVDNRAVVPDDKIPEYAHLACLPVYLYDGHVSAGGKSELCANQSSRSGDKIGLAVGKSVIKGGLQAGLESFGHQRLVAICDPPQFGKADFFKRGAGCLNNAAAHRERVGPRIEHVRCQREHFLFHTRGGSV